MYNNPHLILENLPETLFVVDISGTILYINKSITALAGYSPEELKGQSLKIFDLHPDDNVRTDYELLQAGKVGRFDSEGWKIRKNGTTFWAEMEISRIVSNETTTGFLCVLRDQTERKKEELSLRQSEEYNRLIIEGIKDYAVFMIDPEGYILTWNEGGKVNTGYMAEEIIGKHISLFFTSSDIAAKIPELEINLAKETGKYEIDAWRVKKNGSVYWANIILTPLYSNKNKLIGFSKVTRDLTERKTAEETLRQSEELYRSLVEQVTDYGIFMMDEKGRIVSWNEGAKRIKGYSAEEIIGKYFSIFYPEEDIIKGKPAFELKTAKAVGKFEEEGWRIKKDGSKFWANVVITAVYNTENTLIGFSKVTRDLTERKQNERELRSSYENARILANELRITNSELSYANQELEQFTSIVSHDLQEPIRTIKGFLQLIDLKLDSSQNKDLKVYIDKSIKAAGRMKDLIQNLLHYSQLSKGELVEQKINVKELMNQAFQNLKSAVDQCGASLKFETGIEEVKGDPVQLLQLIQNLLSNALKFTNGKAPEVSVSCRKVNGHVQFAITDNGIGIADSDKNKVFEIFKRLHTAKDYPGMGIGLSICKKIVDRHRGKIWPESEPGKGTTFFFTLNEQMPDIPAS